MHKPLPTYRSEATNEEIALNSDPDRFVWLRIPSVGELDSILLEHERIRLDEVWANKLLVKRQGEDYIEGLASSGSGGLRYFRNSVMKGYVGSDKTRGLAADLRAMPLSEQQALLSRLRPRSRSECEIVASVTGVSEFLYDDFRGKLATLGSAERFVDHIVAVATTHGARAGAYERYTEILGMLRARKLLLFPISFRSWLSNVKWRGVQNPAYVGDLATLMNEVGAYLDGPDRRGRQSNSAAVAVLMTSVTSIDDFSPKLIDAIEDSFTALFKSTNERPGHARSIAQSFRDLWNHKHPERPFEQTRTVRLKAPEELRTSGEFSWLVAANPAMEQWRGPLAAFVDARPSKSKQASVADLNYVCDFLLSLDDPPTAPERVVRSKYIYDATFANKRTLMYHLSTSIFKGKRRNRIMGHVREFFGWYPDWLAGNGQTELASTYINPIADHDRFTREGNPGQSPRTALPSWLLREMHKTILEDDFAFPKKSAGTDWVNVFDTTVGKVTKQWWPGTAICLLLLLDLPLRSHQARWLDSGVFDETYFDPVLGKEVENANPLKIRGRREACLRQLHDTLRQERWMGLYVNTNKTAEWDGSTPPGYEVPYIDKAIASLLVQMKDWGLRYLPPLASPITYMEEAAKRGQLKASSKDKLPDIAPIFRDPASPQKNRPMSYDKVARLYLRVLTETERRLKRTTGQDIELTLIKNGKRVWKYDLHTLRVSGISAMIEAGVPLEVVSQFVAGHASLVMTLWYLKYSPGKLREAIAKAQQQAAADADFVGSASFLEHIEKLSPFLLSKHGRKRTGDGDVAYMALKQHTGLWAISTDGICPGTSCSTGGEYDDRNGGYGPVPGGRRCGLCRYWITGPTFILGQMAAANNLIYQIRKNGIELKEARNSLIELDDAGERNAAARVRNRIELLERELTVDINEWQSRYQYAVSSSELLDQYIETRNALTSDSNLPAPLVTPSSAEQLKITLQEADDFVLLEHITQMCDLQPGFKNREAVLEKNRILSKVLAANGLPPFLLVPDDKQAEVASNLMSSMLLQYVNAQDRAHVLSGDIKLNAIPALDEDLRRLAQTVERKQKVIPIAAM